MKNAQMLQTYQTSHHNTEVYCLHYKIFQGAAYQMNIASIAKSLESTPYYFKLSETIATFHKHKLKTDLFEIAFPPYISGVSMLQ